MNYNKTELINEVVKDRSHYKYEVRAILDDIFETITRLLEQGNRVSIRGFGVFETKDVKGHPIAHPQTGERMMVEDYKNVVFRPGEDLIRRVRAD